MRSENKEESLGWLESSFWVVLFWASCLVLSPTADARVFCVTPDGAGERSGAGWENAYGEAEFSTALSAAEAGSEFWVAEGVYRPSSDDRRASFFLKTGVRLYGGFSGTEGKREERDWTRYVSVLTGDLAGDDGRDAKGVTVSADAIRGENSLVVIKSMFCEDDSVLDGFTVCGGSCSLFDLPFNSERLAGGMFNIQSSPLVANCVFRGNGAPRDKISGNNNQRGGMYNRASSPKVVACTFVENRSGHGGGMANEEGSAPLVTRCDFVGNGTFRAGAGGGMYNNGSRPTVEHCLFEGNGADKGGGMYNNASDPVVRRCRFLRNGTEGKGGGMGNEKSSPVVTHCVFAENVSQLGGGGMENHGGSAPRIINVTFFKNRDEGTKRYRRGGGALHNDRGHPIVVNCTFASNDAAEGTGMYNENSRPTVANSIFWNECVPGSDRVDIADDGKGGRYVRCILREVGVRGNPDSEDIVSGDPGLSPLRDHGGATPTCAVSPDGNAVDAGLPAGTAVSADAVVPSDDQRGYARSGRVDIGAYESGAALPGGFVLTASAGRGGTIVPSGAVHVPDGAGQTFTIRADAGFRIRSVRVDSIVIPVGAHIREYAYAFRDVREDHSITASFEEEAFDVLEFVSRPAGPLPAGKPHTFGLLLSGDAAIGTVAEVLPEYRDASGRPRNEWSWWAELPLRSPHFDLIFQPSDGLEAGELICTVRLQGGTVLSARTPVSVASKDSPAPTPEGPSRPSPRPEPKPKPEPEPGPNPNPTPEMRRLPLPDDPMLWRAELAESGEEGVFLVSLFAPISLPDRPVGVRADGTHFVAGIESAVLYRNGLPVASRASESRGGDYRLKLTGRVRRDDRERAAVTRVAVRLADGSEAVREFPEGILKIGSVPGGKREAPDGGSGSRGGGCDALALGALAFVFVLRLPLRRGGRSR